jgi:hypothetical protein
MPSRPSITKDAIPDLLRTLGSPWGDQVELDPSLGASQERGRRGELRLRLRWDDQAFEFVVASQSRSTPKAIDQAILEARRLGLASGLPPMIIVPYLDERRLDRLARESVSGIDLSGNGLVIVPGRLLLRRSGCPNQYPDSQPTRYAYRGATSIVPRVFLCQPEFASVGAIQEAIERRGGSIALSTVSKALARMVEDVFVERTESRIGLVQPESLLDRLRDDFQPPRARATIRVKVAGPLAGVFDLANDDRRRPRLVLSGASSQDRYAAGIRSDEPVAFCERLAEIRERIGDRWEETERFADLTVIETKDRNPFFDARVDEEGIAHASPIQAYLELSAGDKRDREMADDIRTLILREVDEARGA